MAEKVNHPGHYGGDTTYEAIKVIDAWQLGFCLGNTVKYICRAPHKGTELEDLKKAAWYLEHRIKQLTVTPAELKDGICDCQAPNGYPVCETCCRMRK